MKNIEESKELNDWEVTDEAKKKLKNHKGFDSVKQWLDIINKVIGRHFKWIE